MVQVKIERFEEGLHDLLVDALYLNKPVKEAERIALSYAEMFRQDPIYQRISLSTINLSKLYYPDSFKEAQTI